jgi:hypothetical protein
MAEQSRPSAARHGPAKQSEALPSTAGEAITAWRGLAWALPNRAKQAWRRPTKLSAAKRGAFMLGPSIAG